MGIQSDADRICKAVWKHVEPASVPVSAFTSKCEEAVLGADTAKPSKQCVWENAKDKFTLNKDKTKIELPEDKVILCLVRFAQKAKWPTAQPVVAPKVVAAPKAVELPADATAVDAKPAAEAPKAAGLPGDATPAALSGDVTPAALSNDATPVALAADVTPVDANPAVAVKAVALPVDVTPADALSLKNRWWIQAGIFHNVTPTGLSVDGNDPKVSYTQGINLAGRVGALVAPVSLGAYWAYTTFVGLQAEYATFKAENGESPYSNKLSAWGAGPAVSGYFVYGSGNSGPRVLFGPDLALTVGKLSTEGLVDVGIPGRLYEATGQRTLGTALAGATLGLELAGGPGRPAVVFLLGIGARYFIHGDQVLDTPPGYEGAMVRLKSGPTFDSLKFSLGFNY